ncbi:MAG: hypothetical protein ACI8PZ_004062 [Myxococcota bacterium]|jgi:hypothetical protein
MRTLLPAAIALTVALPAHAGWLADAGFDAGLRGGVAFQDAATDLDGMPSAPAVPESDAVDVSLELTAIASWDLPRPECRFEYRQFKTTGRCIPTILPSRGPVKAEVARRGREDTVCRVAVCRLV